MATANGDRNLLFGILALQMDFIRRDALVQAMNAWVLDKTKSRDKSWWNKGRCRADVQTLLEALVAEHLEMHGGDAEKSLAAISSVRSVREELKGITDPTFRPAWPTSRPPRPRRCGPDATVALRPGRPSDEGRRFRILRPYAEGRSGQGVRRPRRRTAPRGGA